MHLKKVNGAQERNRQRETERKERPVRAARYSSIPASTYSHLAPLLLLLLLILFVLLLLFFPGPEMYLVIKKYSRNKLEQLRVKKAVIKILWLGPA